MTPAGSDGSDDPASGRRVSRTGADGLAGCRELARFSLDGSGATFFGDVAGSGEFFPEGVSAELKEG